MVFFVRRRRSHVWRPHLRVPVHLGAILTKKGGFVLMDLGSRGDVNDGLHLRNIKIKTCSQHLQHIHY